MNISNRSRLIAITLLLCLAVMFIPTYPAYADTQSVIPSVAQAGSETFAPYTDDRVLKGQNARDDYYFETGKGRTLTAGSYLDLAYSHSQTLVAKASSLTIMMDDVPLHSVTFESATTGQTSVRIDLSSLALQPGFHKLSFWAHMELGLNMCIDPDNAAMWTTVHKSTRLTLSYAKTYGSADLTAYPSPFFEKGAANPMQSIIVVPDDAEQAEFAAAARLVQYYAGQATDKRIQFQVYPESEVTDSQLSSYNAIWIGQPQRWKTRGQAMIEAAKTPPYAAQANAQGFIAVVSSPWSSNALPVPNLVVNGSAEELTRASLILTDETLFSQMQGRLSPIPASLHSKEAAAAQPKVGSRYTVPFNKIGYSNMTLEGKREAAATISYSLPSYWDIENGAHLNLKFRHSQAIDYGKSAVTVKVNGTPAETRKLTKTSAEEGLLELDLKQEWIGVRRAINVEVLFQFSESASSDSKSPSAGQQSDYCGDPYKGNWAVIDSSSTLTIIPLPKQTINLQSLPFPYVGDAQWTQAAFLLSDRFGSRQLSTAMTLIGLIGRDVQDNSGLKLIRTSDPNVKDAIKDLNIVYIGPYSSVPDFLNAGERLAVLYKDEKIVSNHPKVELLSELQTRSAVIHISRSPLNSNRGLLLLAAASSDREKSIASTLTDPLEASKLTGKFIMIDSADKVHTFPAAADPEPVLQTNKKKVAWEEAALPNLSPIMFWLAFALIVIVLFSVYWTMRKRQ